MFFATIGKVVKGLFVGKWREVYICNGCGKIYTSTSNVCGKCGLSGFYQTTGHKERIARRTILGWEFKEDN